MAISKPINYFLGGLVKGFPKTQYEKIAEMIDKINALSSTPNALTVNSITPKTGSITTISGGRVEKHTASAINVSATATGAQLATGYFTSTSAAPVTITLPLATDCVTALGAVAGSTFDFMVDASGGANTVTVAVNTGITAATPVITGGGTLTVSVANGVGIFRLIFTSTTAARLYRIG